MAQSVPKWLRVFVENLEGGYRGVAQDIDSIKHLLRGIQWRQDAIIAFFKIPTQPDVLELTLNPSSAFINDIVTKARFAGLGESLPVKRKAKRRRKTRSRRRKK